MKNNKEDIDILPKKITVYHYSTVLDDNNVIVDPKQGLKNKHSYSKHYYNKYKTPLIWLYTDLSKTERIIVQGSNLYSSKVDRGVICDLNLYQKDSRIFDVIYPNTKRFIELFFKKGGYDFDYLFSKLKSVGYSGVYYITQDIPMISYFYPLKMKKVK